MNNKIRKNILDIKYNKYVQYQITSIIIAFTYIIGVCIGLITRQIRFTPLQLFILSGTSLFILIPCLYYYDKSTWYIKRIPRQIKKLEI